MSLPGKTVSLDVKKNMDGYRVEQAFRDACSLGNRAELKEIVSQLSVEKLDEILSNSKNFPTGTPMFEAIICEQADIVEELIHLGCDLEQECSLDIFFPIQFVDTGPALCVACSTGNIRCVDLLLDAGTSVNHSGKFSTPLMAACENGSTELVSKLLESGAQVNAHALCEEGKIPLHVTCLYHACVDNVRLLLAYGADVNSLDRQGHSPLFYACLGGNCSIAELLLQHEDLESSTEDKVKMLWLLGAECIIRLDDKMAAIEYWKWAFCLDPGFLTYKDTVARTLTEDQRSSALCQELNTIEDVTHLMNDNARLKMQTLIFLYLVLGWRKETISFLTSELSRALTRRQSWESCQLLVFSDNMPGSLTGKDVASASDNLSQIIEELLDVLEPGQNTQPITHMETILLAMISQILQLLEKMIASAAKEHQKALRLKIQLGYDSERGSLQETCLQLVEGFMGVLKVLSMYAKTSETRQKIMGKLRTFRFLCQSPAQADLKLNCAVWLIAVHGGPCCKYSLTWHHQKLFPCADITKLLVECGFDINCVNGVGNTPLHYCLDCQEPDHRVFHALLDSGAEIDLPNKAGKRPCDLDVIRKRPAFQISSAKYRTLRSLAAEVIVKNRIAYVATLPDTLVHFVLARDYIAPK